jgi:hypothetical protein
MDQSVSNELALSAFRAVDFDWTRRLDSIWRDASCHVEGLHRHVSDMLMSEFVIGTGSVDSSPVGRVIVGQKGVGKTHLIGRLRQRIWETGGWFILLDFVDVKNFWQSAALSFLSSLQRPMSEGAAQHEIVLERLSVELDLPRQHQAMAAQLCTRSDEISEDLVHAFLGGLRRKSQAEAQRHRDTLRALLLLSSPDWSVSDLAFSWLQGQETDDTMAKALDFASARQSPAEIVRGLCWIMGLTGPTLIAVDQIDAIVSEHNTRSGAGGPSEADSHKAQSIIEALACGLMELHEVKGRALTLVACLEATWDIIKNKAISSASDRFHDALQLRTIQNSEVAQLLVGGRLASAYTKQGFAPPYPTWPFKPEAFGAAVDFRPRQLLQRCDKHRSQCIVEGRVLELSNLREGPTPPPSPPSPDLDAEYERLKGNAHIEDLLSPQKEDQLFRDLLLDVLSVYVRQTHTLDTVDLSVDADFNQKPPALHGRLRFVYGEEGDRERHYCFRALGHSQANAVQARLRTAMTASGIDRALPFRSLFILRRKKFPGGDKTAQLVEEFRRAGGCVIEPSDDDLSSFVALQALLHKAPAGLDDWLRARKPLCESNLFMKSGLCDRLTTRTHDENVSNSGPESSKESRDAAARSKAEAPGAGQGTGSRQIAVGRRLEGGGLGRREALSIELLPRHTAILASAGSGKTVLLRRIVEEAALLGVPAIVLDTNNDLARLGEAWPERPAAWSEEDAAKAEAYRERAEVVLWTPGATKGNPLYLGLLPDFAAIGDDDDEREKCVQMALATLSPLARATGKTKDLQEAVLCRAIGSFARAGGGDLNDLIRLLADLPEGVSEISDAGKLAARIADQLRAAIEKNPLMKNDGPQLNVGELFQASAPGKVRISVVNFSELGADNVRQAFVNRLQIALFSWIKRNPSKTGRLYAMDEAQIFTPAQKSTPCKESTQSLAAQARKYGLGMIFATQAPKGIDNKVISNCTTHFYGKMSAPATLTAVQEMAAARGGNVRDFATLTRGQFYFSTEGFEKPFKISAPLCLSHHPANPLSEHEVISLAGRWRR